MKSSAGNFKTARIFKTMPLRRQTNFKQWFDYYFLSCSIICILRKAVLQCVTEVCSNYDC